jgi:hypothetical protein
MASVYDRLGWAGMLNGEFSMGADALARCIEIWLAQPPELQDRVSIAVQHRYMASLLLFARRFDDAEAASREAIERLSAALAPEHYAVGMAQCGLAWALAESGSIAEAEALARAGLALMEASPATPPDQMMNARAILGLVLLHAGKAAEATAPLLESVSLWTLWTDWDPRIAPFADALEAASIETGQPVPDVVATFRASLAAERP